MAAVRVYTADAAAVVQSSPNNIQPFFNSGFFPR